MTPRRWVARAAWLVAALVLVGCASRSDRVILLPQADGRPSGAVTVRTTQGEAVLAEPFAQATVTAGRVESGKTTADQVKADFGALLDVQPARPRQWTVFFEPGGSTLTADSRAALAELRAALAAYTAGELVVTGHTDRVGPVTDNDRLSVVRANAVRDMLIAAGAPAERVVAQGRGEREPVVPTADEVAEPKNRRVEIKLR